MKMNELDEVTKVYSSQQAINKMRLWLNAFNSRQLTVIAGDSIILLSRTSSFILLDEQEALCLAKLKELGIEE